MHLGIFIVKCVGLSVGLLVCRSVHELVCQTFFTQKLRENGGNCPVRRTGGVREASGEASGEVYRS